PSSTLFPYTTLFRSCGCVGRTACPGGGSAVRSLSRLPLLGLQFLFRGPMEAEQQTKREPWAAVCSHLGRETRPSRFVRAEESLCRRRPLGAYPAIDSDESFSQELGSAHRDRVGPLRRSQDIHSGRRRRISRCGPHACSDQLAAASVSRGGPKYPLCTISNAVHGSSAQSEPVETVYPHEWHAQRAGHCAILRNAIHSVSIPVEPEYPA